MGNKRCNFAVVVVAAADDDDDDDAAQPSFLVTPQDQIVTIGRRAILRCQVTGNPAPAVFWNKQSSQVSLILPGAGRSKGTGTVFRISSGTRQSALTLSDVC